MKKFESGKSYRVNDTDNSTVTVTSRTKCYVTLAGAYTGRYKVSANDFFGLGENVLLPCMIGRAHKCFLFAAHEEGEG